MAEKELNWVDPDILVYYESTGDEMPSFDRVRETSFRDFFNHEWSLPEFDDIREKWDRHIISNDPYERVFGKTALWSLVQLRRIQQKIRENIL